jgi:hypothetical protein
MAWGASLSKNLRHPQMRSGNLIEIRQTLLLSHDLDGQTAWIRIKQFELI